ncbi:MAG: hypothetical protein A2998_02700 [Candidatus Staskawiczbacteria bacterium RIFCSPLOWO2_01_FULL_37_25b]|uniref:Uncharacterized protein n=1 Tax=Candidatus Staskawiczbacteria bacterium RIFCSPLOWO2_01_FULL_37_25b TaxID=1802213 RepID=A0A1G2IB87_9BACT|nr:MAG: hypothetical protein A2998_02700 [Candidatus Staskawiczbacteria bacterium RIFCSPLOWO2_01_FULL_37_25b]
MRKVRIHCVGVSPLMMDKMSDETLEGLATGVRPPEVKDKPAVEKAAVKIYRDDNGRIALPAEMLVGALVFAGQKVKNGRKQISTAKTTMLFELLQLNNVFLPLTNGQPAAEDLPWVVDKRKGIGNQARTPTAVCIIRPKFLHWEFDCEIEYNEDRVNGEVVRQLFNVAGSSEGLGSFRPNKKGPFGRFKVTEWNEEKVAA